jgi:hypothetical protein
MRMISKKLGELGENSKLKLVGRPIILDILNHFLSVFFGYFKLTLCRVAQNERILVQFISCWSVLRVSVEAFPDKLFAIIKFFILPDI